MGRSSAQASPSSGKRVLIFRKVVLSSEVVAAPAGYYDILAIGNGGSGARCTTPNGRATGGGGPAWARDWGKFDAPTNVTVTIGARSPGLATASGNSNGVDGGTTSVTGIADPINLTGGKGGLFSASQVAVNGGDGGTATGGKIRANGGRGGNVTSTSAGVKATGGGAIDLFCLGANRTRGGDIGGTSTADQASGGAGIAGRGGDCTTNALSSGGGAGGDALDATPGSATIGPNILGARSETTASPADALILDLLLSYPGLNPSGGGGSTAIPPPGGGSNGASGSNFSAPLGATGAAVGTTSLVVAESSRGGGTGGGATSNGSLVGISPAGAAMVVISVYAEVT